MNGVIVVDKPEGLTSHDVVNRIRRVVGTRKVGHLGTLDPMATGVLPVVIGRATRLAQFLASNDKRYTAKIRFGWATDTYDREGVRVSPEVEPRLTADQIEGALAQFRGVIRQTPPAFSAKKIGGTPAYRLARQQVAVELAPVDVEVYSLELEGLEGPLAQVRVHCSTGTYVRSIAHDLGQRLGCGAFLSFLRRTASGEFLEEHSHPLPELERLQTEGRLAEAVIPASRLLPQFPSATMDTLAAGQIRQGRDFRVSPFLAPIGAKYVKAIDSEGELIAIGEARLPHLYHPILVM